MSVDAYATAERTEVSRPECPGCGGAMSWWSGYRRFVRSAGACRAIFVRRARCRACRRTDAVLPAFVLVRRLDEAATVGAVVAQVVAGPAGVRPAAEAAQVPHTTAREWVRRFGERAEELAVAFSALAVELGGEAAVSVAGTAGAALAAIGAAFEAAAALPGWLVLGCWRFTSAVSGGRLLATNTDSPYLVVGRRRFMPPVP